LSRVKTLNGQRVHRIGPVHTVVKMLKPTAAMSQNADDSVL